MQESIFDPTNVKRAKRQFKSNYFIKRLGAMLKSGTDHLWCDDGVYVCCRHIFDVTVTVTVALSSCHVMSCSCRVRLHVLF